MLNKTHLLLHKIKLLLAMSLNNKKPQFGTLSTKFPHLWKTGDIKEFKYYAFHP